MENKAKTIYETLHSLGYYVVQGSQAHFDEKIPVTITFQIDNERCDYTLDGQISAQHVSVAVDIWTNEITAEGDEENVESASHASERILHEVEVAMRKAGYGLDFSATVPNPVGALVHKTCRFESF